MRGSLVRRGKKGSKRWALVLDFGYVTDPATGTKKRKQKWVTFHGTEKQAETKLTDLVGKADRNEFIEPSKITAIDYLRTWLPCVQATRRPSTYRVYESIIKHIATAPIATVLLQRLRDSDLERYYAELPFKATTVAVHHAVWHRALRKAVKERLIVTSPALDVERPRSVRDPAAAAREKCLSADEARRLREAAGTFGPQVAAFLVLAIDTGARKSELAGLRWSDLDVDAGTVTIQRQLEEKDAKDGSPLFGPTKTKRSRVVTLGAETLARLRAHKAAQATIKLRNRTTYADYGLMFAKEPADLQTPKAALGQPIRTLAERTFRRVCGAATVTPIVFHGLRHTCATLLLGANVPIQIVSKRLGHANVAMTLNIYAHAMPDAQRAAAATLDAVLANG